MTMRGMGRARPRMYFPLFFPLSLFPCHFTSFLNLGDFWEKEKEIGEPG